MIIEDPDALTELERRITHGTELLLASVTTQSNGVLPLAFETLSKAIEIAQREQIQEQDEELLSIAYHNRGIIRCLQVEQEESIEDFTHAIAWTISPAASRYAHAQALLCAGDIEQAHEEISLVINEDHPSYRADARYVRGFIKSEAQDLQGAIKDLKRAITLGLNHIDVFASLAKCYALQGRWDKAETLWTHLTGSVNGNEQEDGFLLRYNQGLIQMGLGKYEQAMNTLQTNPYTHGNERFVSITMAGCLYKMGQTTQAELKIEELDMQEDEIRFVCSDELLVPVDMFHEDYRPRMFGDSKHFQGTQN